MNAGDVEDLRSLVGRRVRLLEDFYTTPAGTVGVVAEYGRSTTCDYLVVLWCVSLAEERYVVDTEEEDDFSRHPELDIEETRILEVLEEIPQSWCESCRREVGPRETIEEKCPGCGESLIHVLVSPETWPEGAQVQPEDEW